MDFTSLLKLVAEIDFQKKTGSLTAGPIKLTNIPLSAVPALSGEPQRIERIISKCFITRQVMWIDFVNEKPEWVVASLEEVTRALDSEAALLSTSTSSADKVLHRLLTGWSNSCLLMSKETRGAADAEKDSRIHDFGSERIHAYEMLPDVMKKNRRDIYPIVRAVAEFLPDGNRIRKDAQLRIAEGTDVLVRLYYLRGDDIELPSWTIN